MMNYKACADSFKKFGCGYMNTIMYKNAQNRAIELTMSCDREEAMEQLGMWMDMAYDDRNTVVYMACYDIWKDLK